MQKIESFWFSSVVQLLIICHSYGGHLKSSKLSSNIFELFKLSGPDSVIIGNF
jgi:hypothetical protein